MNALIPTGAPVPRGWDRRGLPAWTYRSPALLALERDNLFLTHWQVAGHECDLPSPGDWLSFDMLGERAVVVRSQDGALRAFHNICRHRGSRLVDGAQGQCRGALVCPFHGWVYDLDGRLRGAAQPGTFDALDRDAFGLRPIEMQTFHGFVFLRFRPGPQPAVADLLAPYGALLAAHAPEQAWLPEGLRRSWLYLGLFPNTVIALTPEALSYYQDLPVSARETRLSGRLYRRAHEDRPTRLARYLQNRIDRDTSVEDRQLSVWSDESMLSGSFEGFHLSDLEWGLRRHHDGLRRLMPVMDLAEAPPEADVERINDDLICDRSKADQDAPTSGPAVRRRTP